jgi:hypothetical protein
MLMYGQFDRVFKNADPGSCRNGDVTETPGSQNETLCVCY